MDEEINNGQGYPSTGGCQSSSNYVNGSERSGDSREEKTGDGEETFLMYGHRWTRKSLDAYYEETKNKSHTWSRNSY